MGNAKSGGFVYYFLIDMVLVGLQRELAIGKMVAAIETLCENTDRKQRCIERMARISTSVQCYH